MKKHVIYILLILLLIFPACKSKIHRPHIENGFIDLSNWDFKKNGNVELNGKWEIYNNLFLGPKDFKIKKNQRNYIDIPNKKIKKKGIATFRIKLRIKKNTIYAVRLNKIYEAYKIWINNKFILENGIAGNSINNMKPSEKQRIIPISTSTGNVEIIIQAANFHHKTFGITSPIKFGLINNIHNEKNISELFNMFLIGILFILSIYSFHFYISNSKFKSLLFFFILNIIIIIRTFLIERFMIFNNINFSNYFINNKLEFLTMTIGVSIFYHFLTEEFNAKKSKNILFIIDIINLLTSIFIIFFPYRYFRNIILYYQIFLGISTLYAFYIVINAMIKKEFSILFSIGVIVLISSIILEIIWDRLKYPMFNFIPISFCFFVTIQTIIIALNFSHSIKEIELYSKNMEEKVKERTAQLNGVIINKTNFFMNIAHEIKTPLTLINNYFYSIIKKQGKTKELSIVKNQLNNLLKNIIDILNIEKIKMGQILYVHNDIINFSEFLKQKIIFFKNIASINNIEITSKIEKQIFIKLDTNAADRIINNIIDNAIKYSEEKGKIDINLSSDNENLYLRIKDTGIGIPNKEIKNIFNPYFQSKNHKKSLYGIGLGLSIIKSIIDSVDGTIEVQNIDPKGTQFIIKLNKYYPKNIKKLKTITGNSITDTFQIDNIDDIEIKYDESKNTILIVENDIDLLIYMINQMKSFFNIHYTTNASDGLKLLEENNDINLIISDIIMDEINGFQFYNKIKTIKRLEDIPIIFISGKVTDANKLKGLKMGAIDFISKPFNIEELIHKSKSVIKQNKKLINKNLSNQKKKILKTIDKQNKSKIKIIFEEQSSYFKISKREKDIINLIIEGKENKEISDELKISINTVKNHIQNIFKKCGVQNRIELINKLTSH